MKLGIKLPIVVDSICRIVNFDFNLDRDFYVELAKTLQLKKVRGFEFMRAGRNEDGGYLLLDDFEPRKIAYSFGISDDFSWDDDIADRGCDVFMYDITIEELPKYRPEFHFFKEGIGRFKDPLKNLDTLEHFIERNGHQNQRNMILKMDVEDAEWDFLETVKSETLDQFDQIIFEFHHLLSATTFEEKARLLRLLNKINQTHQAIHIHGNNVEISIAIDEMNFPNMIEVTYANRSNYEFEDAEIILPNPTVDLPNIPRYPEIELGNWNARFKNS